MAWGTQFTDAIFIRNMNFRSKMELEETIQEYTDELKSTESRLMAYFAQTPTQDPEDPQKVAYDAENAIRSEMEDYRYTHQRLGLMILLKEYLDHNPEVDITSLYV